MEFWKRETVIERLEELRQRVRDAQNRLSDFRRCEAFDIVLTDDEKAEFRALEILEDRLP